MPVHPFPTPASRSQAAPPSSDTVVPLHGDQTIDLALLPWCGQSALHARAKLLLILTDLVLLPLVRFVVRRELLAQKFLIQPYVLVGTAKPLPPMAKPVLASPVGSK